MEQEHEFLKAINDDLRKKSSSYLAKRLLLSNFIPQVKPRNTRKKGKKDSSSSNNNAKAKSNNVVPSNSIDSTNDSLSQVTLEQENDLLEGIIEKGVFKSLTGSKQLREIVRKEGGHRKKQGVGYFNVNGDVWEEGPYPTPKFVPQEEKCDSTPSEGMSSQDGLLP